MAWTNNSTSTAADSDTVIAVRDDNFSIVDDSDTTKAVKFQVSGVTTATTRTLTVPDANTTIVGTDATQTLTNKTLTTPTIGSFANATHAHTNAAGGGQITTAALSDHTPWTTPSFSAGNFTGNGSMTWTVAAGDVTTYAYTKTGKVMTIAWQIVTSTVGGTPSTQLRIAIPGGFTAAKAMTVAVPINDNLAGLAIGYASVSASGTLILISKIDTSNWTASTDQTFVYGQITIETTT